LNASLSLLCDPYLPELESSPGPHPCFIRRRVTRDRPSTKPHVHTYIHLPQRLNFRQFRLGGGLSHNDTLCQISPNQLTASPREPLRIRDSRWPPCIGPHQLALTPYPIHFFLDRRSTLLIAGGYSKEEQPRKPQEAVSAAPGLVEPLRNCSLPPSTP
jgi:hypothetical protein